VPTLSPFFNALLTMINAGKLSESREYQIPLPVDPKMRTIKFSVVRPAEAARLPANIFRGGLSPHQLNAVMRFIDAHLSETIPMHVLAGIAGLSQSHFSKAFKVSVSLPPHAYIVRQRVDRAVTLLVKGEMPLVEVAFACGFSDQSHFTRHFHRLVGTSPSRWRRAYRRDAEATTQSPCVLSSRSGGRELVEGREPQMCSIERNAA
jgi:AraC-like DNA-binding protein